MEVASAMGPPDLAASAQMEEAFGALASLFVDHTLALPENPRQTKARKRDGPKGHDAEMVDPPQTGDQPTPAMRMLTTMAQLLIRHDQELQGLRRMDQYILFLNPDPTGALHLLLHETVQWKEKAEKMEDSSLTQMMPLRQHLMLALLTSMRNRLAKLMTSKETDQIYITSVDKGLILADRSFPYHRWDPKTQMLVLDKKTPVSAKKMDQHLEELVEMMQDRELVMRFHALRAPDPKSDRVVPWRLQINIRSDRAYDLLFHLAHNSIWMAVGATMKQHTLHQTPMATALQSMLGQSKGHGKGKQKVHKKSQTKSVS